MTSKNKKVRKKPSGRDAKKTKGVAKGERAQRHAVKKASKSKKPAAVSPPLMETPTVEADPAKEGTGFKIFLDRIDGDTIIGDLMVVFPRTREVLRKHGLRLDVEEAGDIYMTLDAFAALQGVNTETLIRELVEASKELPPPAPQPVPQLAAPPTA